jgi:hypothetical protein
MRKVILLVVCVALTGCKHTQLRDGKKGLVCAHEVQKPVTPAPDTKAEEPKKDSRNLTIQILPIQTLNIGLL